MALKLLIWINFAYCILSNGHGQIENEIELPMPSQRMPAPAGPNGVQLYVTGKGVQHLTSKLAAQFIESSISKMTFNNIHKETVFRSVFLTDIRIFDFKKTGNQYSTRLVEPNGVLFQARNLQLTIKAELLQKRKVFTKLGDIVDTVYLTLSDLSLEMMIGFNRNRIGYPRARIHGCLTKAGNVYADMFSPKVFQQAVKNRQTRNMMEQRICQALKPLVGKLLPKIFKQRPLFIPLARLFPNVLKRLASVPSGIKLGSIRDQLNKIIRRSLIDLRLTADPQFTSLYNSASLPLKGEVVWNNGQTINRNAPFQPTALPTMSQVLSQSAVKNKMAHLAISDYVINSLFYQAQENGGIKIEINMAELPGPAKALFDAFLSMDKTYQNSNRKIELSTIHFPAVKFDPTSIAMFADFNFILTADQNVILKVFINTDAKIEMQMSNAGTIASSMKMGKVTGALIESKIANFNQDTVNQLADVTSIIMESMINERFFKQGMSLPKNNFFEFYNTDMHFGDRYILISADFDLKKIF